MLYVFVKHAIYHREVYRHRCDIACLQVLRRIHISVIVVSVSDHKLLFPIAADFYDILVFVVLWILILLSSVISSFVVAEISNPVCHGRVSVESHRTFQTLSEVALLKFKY